MVGDDPLLTLTTGRFPDSNFWRERPDNLQRAQKIRYKNVNGDDEVTNGQANSLTDSAAQWCK
jgi:hypothetical protein